MSKELDDKIKNKTIEDIKFLKEIGVIKEIEIDTIKNLIQMIMIRKGLQYTGDIKKDSKTVEEFYNKIGININIDEMVSEVGE